MNPHERLERSTWDLFWLPPEASAVDRPELLVVHAPRPLRFLNAVYRSRLRPEGIAEAVTWVLSLHRQFGSRWTVADTVDATALEGELGASGYVPTHVHDARVTAVDRFAPRSAVDAEVVRVSDERTLRDCWRVNESAFERGGDYVDDDVEVELRQCTGADCRVERFVAYLGAEPVSCGSINFYPA